MLDFCLILFIMLFVLPAILLILFAIYYTHYEQFWHYVVIKVEKIKNILIQKDSKEEVRY